MAMTNSVRKQHNEAAATEEEDEFFEPIDRLELGGVNNSDVKKLREANIRTLTQLLMTPRRALLNIKGVSEAKVDKMISVAEKSTKRAVGWMLGSECQVQRSRRMHITTGSRALDEIMGGGFETGSITEVSGEYRCGKTQLAHTLCITSQLSDEATGATGGKVIFIDTEGTFRPTRVAQIAESGYGMNPDEALDNIVFCRAFTHEQQMLRASQIPDLIIEDEVPFRAVIIDSVTALFRTDFSGRGELSERQQKLNQHLGQLKKLAEDLNLAVLLVNQVTADPGAASMFAAAAPKPIGGNILAHACTTRLSFRKGRDNTRICKLYDSPDMPEAEATFAITEDKGIADAD